MWDTPIREQGKQNLYVRQLIQTSAVLSFKAVSVQKPWETTYTTLYYTQLHKIY